MKDKKLYEVSGGDGAAYGPAFGPVIAEEVATTGDDEGRSHLLLRLVDELIHEGERIELLAVAPRHVGDTLESLRIGESIVGITRVLGSEDPASITALTPGNSRYWAVGHCKALTRESNSVRNAHQR